MSAAEYVQLVVTVPIRRSDLDLSAVIAKNAMQDAAYRFWTLAQNGVLDLIETGAAESAQAIFNESSIVSSFRVEGVGE